MTELEKAIDKMFSKYTVSLYSELTRSKTGAETITKMKQALLTLIQAEVRKARIEELENLHDTHFWDTGDCTELHNRISQLSADEGKE